MSVPKLKGNTAMSSLKDLINKKITKSVKFMGADVKIQKLSVDEVVAIQAKAKAMGNSDDAGIVVLQTIVAYGLEGASELSDEDYRQLPMEELSTLSNLIMAFSGMGADKPGK